MVPDIPAGGGSGHPVAKAADAGTDHAHGVAIGMQAEADHELGSAATALTRDRFGRPGLGRAGSGPPLTCPSGAVVSGPELSAPYLREEDPPCCRRWGRARDALRAWALRRRHGSGQDRPGEGASCHERVRCISSPPSTGRPQAAGPGCRPGVSPLTRPPLRAVPAAACSCAHGGCWPRCAVASAEVAGGAPGSARRRRRTDHSPAG